jgi:hypothetical protein
MTTCELIVPLRGRFESYPSPRRTSHCKAASNDRSQNAANAPGKTNEGIQEEEFALFSVDGDVR